MWTLAIYGIAVLAVSVGVRWLGRPVSFPVGGILGVLPVLFCLPGFLSGRTMLPTDHVLLYTPWSPPSVAPPHNPNLNDAASQFAPWAKAVRMAWKEGSLPLRNRWNGCGSPLAANGNSAAFSPFTFAMFLLPLAQAFTLAAALKLFLASCGMWLWLRELEVSSPAALFGAVCFSYSLALTPLLLFTISSVVALWPWALFALEWLGRTDRPGRAFALLTAVLVSWVLCGHPESATLGAVAAAIFFGARRLLGERIPRAVWMGALGAGALAVGLTAFLWLPQLFAVGASNRGVVAREFREGLPLRVMPHWPAWRYGALTTFYPRALGDGIDSPIIPGGAGNTVEMALGYFGILGWAAALGILRPGSRRDVREKASLALLLCGLGVGTACWPVFEAFLSVPLLGLVFPLRFFAWVSLAGPVVAAFEMDRLRRDIDAGAAAAAWSIAPPLLLGAGAALTFWRFEPAYRAAGGLASEKSALGVTLAVLLLFVAVTFGLVSGRISFFRAALGISLLGVAELSLQGTRLYRWGAAADLFPMTPLTQFLQSRDGPFRVAGEGAALFPGTNVFAGVEDIRTHDPLERRDYVEFLDGTCGYAPAEYFKTIRNIDAPVLDFLNVRYMIRRRGAAAPGARWSPVYGGADGTVFENADVLPRIFSPRRIRFVRGTGSCASGTNALARLGEERERLFARRDWRAEASVCRAAAGPADADLEGDKGPVAVSDYRESANRITFVTESTRRTILVASVVNDGGWSATDGGGRRLDVFFANGPFLAIDVGPGRSLVRLRYAPPGFRAGAAVSILTFVAVLLLSVSRRISRVRYHERT